MSEQGREDFDSDIERAENHAKRAIYDATEASILALLEKAELYQLEFRSLECTTEVLPDYVDLRKRLESVRCGIAL